MEIVYCGGCGRVLRKDEFDRGLARVLDNRPWCAECKPPERDPVPSAPRKQGSSAKHPRVPVGTARRKAAVPAVSKSALVGGAVAIGAGLLLGVVFWGGPTPAPPPPVDRARVEPPREAPGSADAVRLLADLETLASLAPPERILSRCEELSPKFRGTPQEKRFRDIETAAMDLKRAREREAQVARELESIRKMIDEDPRFARYDDIVTRFKTLRDIAGPGGAAIDRRLADYQKDRRESPAQSHAGPFAEDERGFIRNWLVLGVFPNDGDKGLDTDFLGGESGHDPVAGLKVGTLQWGAYRSPESKIDFFGVAHLGIRKPRDYVVAYAACLVQNSDQVAAEFRLGSNDGGALWVDGNLLGKVHRSRSLKIDEDRYRAALPPGVHRVLVKVEQHTQSYEFALRVVSGEGKPLPDLKIWN